MDVWDLYQKKASIRGLTKRDTLLRREGRLLEANIPDSLSYHSITINDEPQDVAIINSDNLNIKTIYSMPNQSLPCGGLVYWMDNHWLITEKDANNEIYTKAKMLQCNFLLKWIDDSGVIHEQWCVIEDGTKYLTGEYEDRNFFVTRGDSRIAMTIGKNEHTSKFRRDCRFLIDNPDSKCKLAYALTKPFKLGWTYNNEGVYCFVLQEVASTEDDNHDLGVADYFKKYPKRVFVDSDEHSTIETDNVLDDGRRVWL